MADRLESLDVFRGLTIAAMILVSTPGTWDSVYWPLEHAGWNGWTPTDLVFPFLLFAMGAAVPFAMSRRRDTGGRLRHVLRRALVLFALGLMLNVIGANAPLNWATFRIPGVLQRIAIVYIIVAWLTERTSTRTQAAAAAAALLGYWAVMVLVPVPGPGRGALSPGDNLAAFVDRAVFGAHLGPPAGDPEGLLSTIPAIATALCGVFAGDWLTRPGLAPRDRVRLWIAGAVAAALGLAWDRVFPINKNLWTSSFALMSAGLAAITLALCYWVLDLKGWRGWEEPFVAFGRNPLAAYFLSVAFDATLTRTLVGSNWSVKTFVYEHAFASWLTPCCGAEAASLLYAVAYVALWAVILTAMYRRHIFLGI